MLFLNTTSKQEVGCVEHSSRPIKRIHHSTRATNNEEIGRAKSGI